MAATFFTEFGNQNSSRKYPFLDDALMRDTDGIELPVDFVVDAALFPLDIVGPVYLQTLVPSTRMLVFADVATGNPVATAEWEPGSAVADVVEAGAYARGIGVVVLGDGVADVFRGRGERTFLPGATTLCPAACVPILQAGVRGFLLPDGTLVTGDVVFAGENGVSVSSYADDGRPTLRFDINGVPPPDAVDCGNTAMGPPITGIVVEQVAGAGIVVSGFDEGVLALTYPAKSLTELCAGTRAIYRPSAYDPCGPAPEPSPQTPVASARIEFDVATLRGGNFTIAAPSTADYVNPISVQPLGGGVDVSGLTVPSGASSGETATAVKRFLRARSAGGGIVITLHGIRYLA